MVGDFFRLLLRPIVRIKKEEWTKCLLMFGYFFLTITSYYILKPVRDSVFIDKYGAENLPYVWLLTIVVLSAVVWVYVKIADRVQKNVLLSSTVIFFVSNLVVFWWLSHSEHKWVAGVFFIWVSIFSVMTVTQFWLYANDLFNSREAKRLFGFVGGGGILGGIMGGVITQSLVGIVGTRGLLLVAAFILAFCALIINIIWEVEQGRTLTAEKHKAESPSGRQSTREVIRLIYQKRYLVLLVGLVCLAKVVSTLVDYQFKNIVQASVVGLDARTAFFGKFFAWLNGFSLFVQFFLTSFMLRRFGVGTALFLLPVGLAFGSVTILAHPALWSAVFAMLYDGSVNYSLNQSSKEVLYLPIFREVRYRVKPFIDMVGYRIAKALGSILILLFVNTLHFNVRTLSIISLVLIAIWLYVIWVMRSEYVNALRDFLKKDLPEKFERTIAGSEAWLVYGLLKQGVRDEKNVQTAVHLYNLASEASFLSEVASRAGAPASDLRVLVSQQIAPQAASNLRKEIRGFLESREMSGSGAGEALQFFAAYGESDADAMEGFLANPEPSLRIAAAAAILLHGRRDDLRERARLVLIETAGSLSAALDPEATARRYLAEWNLDASLRPLLVQALGWLTRDVIRREGALADIRETVRKNDTLLLLLFRLADEKSLPVVIRRQLAVLLAVDGKESAVPHLVKMISDADPWTRDRAIHGLAEMRLRVSEISADPVMVAREMEREISQAFLSRRLLQLYQQAREKEGLKGGPAEDPFVIAQEKRYYETIERILLLLSLMARPEDVRTIYYSLKDPNEHVKANALELLEQVIEQPRLRRAVIMLMDAESASFGIQGLNRIFNTIMGIEQYEETTLDDLLASTDLWAFLSGCYIITALQLGSHYPRLYLLEGSPEAFIRAIALLLRRRLETKTSTGTTHTQTKS